MGVTDLAALTEFTSKIKNGDRKNMEAVLEVENHSMLAIMDETGDSRIQWDKSDPSQVAKARARFDELKKKGYMAYSVSKKGGMDEIINNFDENAERIIMHSQMIGG